MDKDIAVKVLDVTKVYKLYNKPIDRLKESLNPFRRIYHRDFYALNNISFEVKKGETLGIIGKNGSGKSTLLKMITGVLTPTSGNIYINGKVSALLELGAGFNPEFTGIENIYINGSIMGYTKQQMDNKIKDIIDFADIGEYIYQPVKTYSSGMFARLAFAVAINVEPDILIVDEALSVGDIKFQIKCMKKFKELRDKNVTILFVTHDINLIRSFCDRALWINEGQLVCLGEVIDVTSRYVEFMNDKINIKNVENTDFNPINRWGKTPNLIKSVQMLDIDENPIDEVRLGDTINISVVFKVDNIDTKNLSVAISIKNKTGTDLIVSTTYDDNIIFTENSGYIEVNFKFTNYLNSGEYFIVAAIEDRSEGIPQYYDYLEGAKFFKVVEEKPLFGLFSIPVQKSISYLEGE